MLRFAVGQTERRLDCDCASPALAILTLTQISGRRNVSQLFPVYKTTNLNVLLRKIILSSRTYFAKLSNFCNSFLSPHLHLQSDFCFNFPYYVCMYSMVIECSQISMALLNIRPSFNRYQFLQLR